MSERFVAKSVKMSKSFVVKSIKMQNVEDMAALLDLFLYVAEYHPNQTKKLFKRYVSFICKQHYPWKMSHEIAVRSLAISADVCGERELNLLTKTIPAVRNWALGR